jgi:hypothetical protein
VLCRYTLLTFVPVFLFELFRNVAYFYFLIQAGGQHMMDAVT